MYILVWSKIRESLDAEKAEELVKTYLKQIRIYSNCLIYSSLFLKSVKFGCCSFYLVKKEITVTCTRVLPIVAFTYY